MAHDPLSRIFAALADPIRRAILGHLRDGDATVGELAARFPVSQPAISKHLKVLEAAGLVSRRRQATARLSRLEAEPLKEATGWMASYREYWTESHDRLDDLLAGLQQNGRRAGDMSDGRWQQGRPAGTEQQEIEHPNIDHAQEDPS